MENETELLLCDWRPAGGRTGPVLNILWLCLPLLSCQWTAVCSQTERNMRTVLRRKQKGLQTWRVLGFNNVINISQWSLEVTTVWLQTSRVTRTQSLVLCSGRVKQASTIETSSVCVTALALAAVLSLSWIGRLVAAARLRQAARDTFTIKTPGRWV